MKLHQLRYIQEVVKQRLNISNAANALHTSQSGVSKQIQLLEEELKLQIFQRSGKRILGVTEPGAIILRLSENVLSAIENIKRVGADFSQKDIGSLTIAATHTQARYLLPTVVQAFMLQFPEVVLSIHQGNPTQVAEQVVTGEADLGIATESIGSYTSLVCLPCYQWNRCVIAPYRHPILTDTPLTLAKIACYPLITYDFAFTGGSLVSQVFNQAGITPNVVLTAIDADVIKTYVKLGLGIGLLAGMAYNPERDNELGAVDVAHLFPASTTYIGLRRDVYLRDYIYAFIQLLAPQLERKVVAMAQKKI